MLEMHVHTCFMFNIEEKYIECQPVEDEDLALVNDVLHI